MNSAPRNCEACRWWSEMLAASTGAGNVKALCLSATSPHAGRWMVGRGSCDQFQAGAPVDAPAGAAS